MGTLYSFKERIDLVKELAALGNSERQIAGRMNMPRNQVRKLQGNERSESMKKPVIENPVMFVVAVIVFVVVTTLIIVAIAHGVTPGNGFGG